MTPANDDELQALRRRAYGPNADIHLESRALQRLRELEGAVRVQEPAPPVDSSEAAPAPAPPVSVEGETPSTAQHTLRPPLRVRRPSPMIVLGVAVVAAILTVALVLVQRVHTDPLQVGATQITRLSTDPAYTIPTYYFGTAFGRDLEARGFQEFYGLRVVVTVGSIEGNGSTDACVNIYPAADITNPNSSGYSGQVLIGCAAGAFPAIVQFRVDAAGLPPELRSAFPQPVPLQFVYDNVHDEVVVFTEK